MILKVVKLKFIGLYFRLVYCFNGANWFNFRKKNQKRFILKNVLKAAFLKACFGERLNQKCGMNIFFLKVSFVFEYLVKGRGNVGSSGDFDKDRVSNQRR